VQDKVVVLRPFYDKGSVKDVIYGKKRSDVKQPYDTKYEYHAD
jgi:hypothetical protein